MIKLLIITYDFPPVGGVGIQRITKWIKHLPANGIRPVVLTNEHGLGYVLDNSLMQIDYIKRTKVYRIGGKQLKKYHKLKENGRLYSIHNFLLLFKYIRGMDIYSSWYYEIKNDIIRIVEQENIDCVLTTSPPHSTHLFGKHLKTIYGIPWIIDLRDSLTDWPLRKKSLSTQVISCIESFYEKSFYNISDKVIFATDYMKKHAQIRRKNLSDNKAHVITNGFDPEDFEINEQYILKDDKFKITYTGTIHPKMDPRPFCNAVIHLINNKFIPANDIVIRIVGMIEKNKKSILETLADVTSIEFSGHVNHKEAIKHQLAADLLLLLVPYSKSEIEKEILTGKVFEYIGSGKPIFALTLEGELADLIKENKFGYVANPGNPDEVEATLFRAYQNWKMGESVLSDKNRGKFTRESQCKTLSNIIKEVVKQNKSGVSK